MKVQKTIQKLKISTHLETVLDQLESVTIFDKNFYKTASLHNKDNQEDTNTIL